MDNLFYNFRIRVDTETWGREACELIDYDSKNLFKSNFEIRSNGYIYRCENQVLFSKEKIKESQFQKLLEIKDNEDNFEIIRNPYEKDQTNNISSKNSAWFLLKQSKMNEKLGKYKIHQGEIIKIGRIITRIKDIRFDTSKINNNFNTINNSSINHNNSINNSKNSNYFKLKDIDDDILLQKKKLILNINSPYYEKMLDMANQRSATDSNFQDKVQILQLNNNKLKTKANNDTQKTLTIDSQPRKKDKLCRICYTEEENELENPIIQPCHCSGSCKYIHLKCIKQWINTKSCLKVDQNDYCSVFVFTESECELCKTKLPDYVIHNGKFFSLLDFSDEFKNYLILESLTLDKENNKFLYVITLDKIGDIKVGRGQFCDILLSDVSVSRIHCIMTVEGKNVFIHDNDSKFGTLVLIQSPIIKMAENLPLNIQVGRTYLNFLLTKETKFFSCCGVSENPNYFYYHKQNEREIETNRIFTVKNDNDADNDSENVEKNNEENKNEIKTDKIQNNEIEEVINIV